MVLAPIGSPRFPLAQDPSVEKKRVEAIKLRLVACELPPPPFLPKFSLPRQNLVDLASGLGTTERAVLGCMLGATVLVAPSTAHGASVTTLALTKAVGVGQHPTKADIEKVQTALKARGFDIEPDGKWGKASERALRVYEAMLTGRDSVAGTTGVVTPGGLLDVSLGSGVGPRWVQMPSSGVGFIRMDHDGFSYGSSMAADTLARAGHRYAAANPGGTVIAINDVSTKSGGNNKDHETHEAGLDIDVLLPTTAGGHSTRVGRADYDRETTYKMIIAFAQDSRVERVLFSDPVLLQRIADSDFPWKAKVQDGGPVHRNHFHVDVKGYAAP